MHYGRYGSGGDDPRLFPLYLGYPTLVHGYDVNSFDQNDCVATATSSCDVIDRLTGSRLALANVEFRFPLLRPFVGANQRTYGPVPVEVAVFGDAGVAWADGQRPGFTASDRRGVSSAGVAFRASLFGFAVGESHSRGRSSPRAAAGFGSSTSPRDGKAIIVSERRTAAFAGGTFPHRITPTGV